MKRGGGESKILCHVEYVPAKCVGGLVFQGSSSGKQVLVAQKYARSSLTLNHL